MCEDCLNRAFLLAKANNELHRARVWLRAWQLIALGLAIGLLVK